MKSLRRTLATAIAAALLTLGMAGPAAAGPMDEPDDVRSGGVTKQEGTAVEYGLIVGLLAIVVV